MIGNVFMISQKKKSRKKTTKKKEKKTVLKIDTDPLFQGKCLI